VFLYGSSTSGNAFTVQQQSAGNVASFVTSTGATAMMINPAGNVGIGLTNPSTLIDIIGNTSVNSISNTIAQFRAASSTGVNDAGIVIGSTNGNAPFIGDNASAASLGLAFQTNRTTRVQINPSGLVGIGTSPTAQLHVYQSNPTGYQLSVNNIANAGGSNYSSFIHSDQAFCGGVGGAGQYTYSGASLLVTSYPNNTSNNSGYTAYFGTSDNAAGSLAPQMVIKSATGYVGIGTATPYSYCHMYSANAGNPLSSGTNSDPSTILRVHCVTCGLDFGFLGAGGAWIQNRQVTASFGTTFPINLNPNGGGVAIGTPLSAVSYTLQVNGSVGASTSYTRTPGSTTSAFYADGASLSSTSYNYVLAGANDTANRLVVFVNGSARTADGGVSNVTIRNDVGSLILGSSAYPNIILGSFVGIGTSSNFNAAFKHFVYGGDSSQTLYGPNTTYGTYLNIGAGTTYCGAGRASVNCSNGNLHIDCATGGYQIYLNYFQGGGSGGTNATVGCYAPFFATGDITAFSSDERLKTKVGLIENALDKVCSLTAFKYIHNETARKNGFTDDNVYVGLSAQEVQKVLPEVVKPAPFDQGTEYDVGLGKSRSGENYLTVQYERVVSLLVEALKEERAERLKIDESLRTTIERLARLEKLLLKE
jgi:hypothetical protein